MFKSPSIVKLGGVFSVGKCVDGVFLAPSAVVHNDLLSNFTAFLLTGNNGFQGDTKVGRSAIPNDASTYQILDPYHAGGKYNNSMSASTLLSRTLTYDAATRTYTSVIVHRNVFHQGVISGEVWEIGRHYWQTMDTPVVTARAVLPQAVVVNAADQLYVDYTITSVYAVPEDFTMVVDLEGTPFNTTVSVRIEDVLTSSFYDLLQPAGAQALRFTSGQVFAPPHVLPNYSDYTDEPAKTVGATGKQRTTVWEFGVNKGNSGQQVMSAVQVNENITYLFNPPIPKSATQKIQFTFVDDYSGIVTL